MRKTIGEGTALQAVREEMKELLVRIDEAGRDSPNLRLSKL
jgi:hypothetical protein